MNQNVNSATSIKSPFDQTHSIAIRIWHWVTFLTITFILLTVLFASTLLNPRANSMAVQKILKEKSIEISDQQAFGVAHFFDDQMWDLHKLLGYGLAFLVLARIVIELTQSQEEKVKSRMKNALSLLKQNGADKKEYKHYLIVKWSYSIFYLVILFMAISGLCLAFGRDLGIPRELNHTIKEVHGFCQYLIYAFIFFHLIGVIYADLGKTKGIVSGMINGGKK
ncbi:MAG: cytochrome b/b6 domain-containing protein [Chloroflexota bacterium]